MEETLIASIGGWFGSYKKFLDVIGLVETDELGDRFSDKKLFARGIEIKNYFNLDISANEIYAKNLQVVKEGYDNIFDVKENVIEALEYLKSKGYKISLNTATNLGLCLNCLKRLDIFKYFDYIQTCDDCGFLKTDVRYYDWAIKKHGEDAKDILFFDDTFEPLETAKKVGVNTVLVYDKITSAKYFDNRDDFDYKVKTISVETLKSMGL